MLFLYQQNNFFTVNPKIINFPNRLQTHATTGFTSDQGEPLILKFHSKCQKMRWSPSRSNPIPHLCFARVTKNRSEMLTVKFSYLLYSEQSRTT